MKKALFISTAWFLPEMCGAKYETRFRRDIILDVFGKNNVTTIGIFWKNNLTKVENGVIPFKTFTSKKEQILNLMHGNTHCVSNSLIDYILAELNNNKYSHVFFDDAAFGRLARCIKDSHPYIRLIAIYHGTSSNLCASSLQSSVANWKRIPQLLAYNISEKKQANIVDVNLVLNKRDFKNFEKFNAVKPTGFFPVCFDDRANLNSTPISGVNYCEGKLNILFVGSHYLPNLEGARWFCKNVLPFLSVPAEFFVVGNKMENYKHEEVFQRDNIHIIGTVDDLSVWYRGADLVVAPIFKGDGMKTKVAEALMYGKYFLGTTESLYGYEELDNKACDTKEDYIREIENYFNSGFKKYYPEYRKQYEMYYSRNAALEIIKGII